MSAAASIIIPAYQAEDVLEDAVSAALAQEHRPTEIVVVNDGSTDGTDRVARSFGERIRYLEQENRGVSSARNRGLEVAGGEYVCFLDADDWISADHLRLNVAKLEEHPEAVLSHGWTAVADAELHPTGPVLEGARGRILDDLARLMPPAVPAVHSAVIRTETVRGVGGFDEGLSTSADYDLWLRLAREGPVEAVERVTARYRKTPGSMFTDLELQVRDIEAIIRKHRNDPVLGALDWNRTRWRFYRSLAGESRNRGDLAGLLRYGVRALLFRARSLVERR